MRFLHLTFWTCVFLTMSCATTEKRTNRQKHVNAAESSSAMQFMFPLESYRRVSRGYTGKHKGVDVSATRGTPIYASEAGWVTYQGRQFRGYGKLVIIEHSKKWATFYAHMNQFNVKQGTWVNKGQIIGYVGNTGRSTGPHLHFEVRYKNTAIDPMPYFNKSDLRFKYSVADNVDHEHHHHDHN